MGDCPRMSIQYYSSRTSCRILLLQHHHYYNPSHRLSKTHHYYIIPFRVARGCQKSFERDDQAFPLNNTLASVRLFSTGIRPLVRVRGSTSLLCIPRATWKRDMVSICCFRLRTLSQSFSPFACVFFFYSWRVRAFVILTTVIKIRLIAPHRVLTSSDTFSVRWKSLVLERVSHCVYLFGLTLFYRQQANESKEQAG